MSVRVTLPVNLADTGPTLTAAATVYWLSPVSSNLSQPGMHFFRVSGSLSASHACCCVTPRRRLPSISMVLFLLVVIVGRRSAAGTHQRSQARRQLAECAE